MVPKQQSTSLCIQNDILCDILTKSARCVFLAYAQPVLFDTTDHNSVLTFLHFWYYRKCKNWIKSTYSCLSDRAHGGCEHKLLLSVITTTTLRPLGCFLGQPFFTIYSSPKCEHCTQAWLTRLRTTHVCSWKATIFILFYFIYFAIVYQRH